MPKKPKKIPAKPNEFTVVIADWKDTQSLLEQLKNVLQGHGLKLQQWDLGSDDYIVTVATKRVTKAEIKTEFDDGPGGSDCDPKEVAL